MTSEMRETNLRVHAHGVLFWVLACAVFGRPFLDPAVRSSGVLDALLIGVLVVAALSTGETRTERAVLGIAAGMVAGTQLAVLTVGDAWLIPVLLCGVVFHGAVTIILARSLVRARTVDLQVLYCAMSVYLLLGVVWALAFAALEAQAPGSLVFEGERFSSPGLHLESTLAFSFTTLTTLGYGEVYPSSRPAASLATLEAVVGQLFLAFIVARLVAIQTASEPRA